MCHFPHYCPLSRRKCLRLQRLNPSVRDRKTNQSHLPHPPTYKQEKPPLHLSGKSDCRKIIQQHPKARTMAYKIETSCLVNIKLQEPVTITPISRIVNLIYHAESNLIFDTITGAVTTRNSIPRVLPSGVI